MSEFTVAVNDPAYPPGTELSVAGVKVLFKNGETVQVSDADLDTNVVSDVQSALGFVAGFTVSDSPVSGDAPVGFVAEAAPPTANVEGGVN